MKAVLCLFVLSVVFVALGYVQASPIAPQGPQELQAQAAQEDDVWEVASFDEVPVEEGRADRHRRVTCDLLSFSTPWGSLNNSACAANCLRMGKGYRGGSCRDGVCHCRK